MLMHVIAHECCADTVRESALKGDPVRNTPCRTGESNLRQRRASPTLYQLNYVPTHNDKKNEVRPIIAVLSG